MPGYLFMTWPSLQVALVQLPQEPLGLVRGAGTYLGGAITQGATPRVLTCLPL